MASLNPCNHFNATKRDFLELLEALNFRARGRGSWQDPAEQPRGAGTAPVSPFDIAWLRNLPPVPSQQLQINTINICTEHIGWEAREGRRKSGDGSQKMIIFRVGWILHTPNRREPRI